MVLNNRQIHVIESYVLGPLNGDFYVYGNIVCALIYGDCDIYAAYFGRSIIGRDIHLVAFVALKLKGPGFGISLLLIIQILILGSGADSKGDSFAPFVQLHIPRL